MAIGLIPTFRKEILLDDITPEQFYVLATASAKKFNWRIGSQSREGFIAYTSFSLGSISEEVQVTLNGNSAVIRSSCTANQLFDWGKNRKNVDNLIRMVDVKKRSMVSEEIARQYEEMAAGFVDGVGILSQAPVSVKEGTNGILSVFLPSKGYFITPILLIINLLVFILMMIDGVSIWSPDIGAIVKWGGNLRFLTMGGEWWRLFTYCFVHIGIFHLVLNMYALIYIGLLLEPHLGRARFLAAYLLTGFAGGVASLAWNEDIVSAGASGAIFGLYGVFLALLTTRFIERNARRTLLTSILVFVVYNLVHGMREGIDNSAHISGLISGMLIGYAYVPDLKHKEQESLKYGLIASLALLFFIGSVFVFRSVDSFDIKNYELSMKQFNNNERLALEVYSLSENVSDEQILHEVKSRSMYFWNDNLRLLSEIDRMKPTYRVKQRNKKLVEYCQLRLRSCDLIVKMIEQHDLSIKEQIAANDRKIERLIEELMKDTGH